MRVWLAGVLTAVVPLPALGLSCLPYGVTDAFLEADASSDAYVPVLGTLQFEASAVPNVDWDKQGEVPPLTLIAATFDGDALTQRGIDVPLRTDVTLEVACSGPWCPNPKPGLVLALLRKTSDQGYAVSTNACGGFIFGDPSQDQINALKDCLTGRGCRPTARR